MVKLYSFKREKDRILKERAMQEAIDYIYELEDLRIHGEISDEEYNMFVEEIIRNGKPPVNDNKFL